MKIINSFLDLEEQNLITKVTRIPTLVIQIGIRIRAFVKKIS